MNSSSDDQTQQPADSGGSNNPSGEFVILLDDPAAEQVAVEASEPAVEKKSEGLKPGEFILLGEPEASDLEPTKASDTSGQTARLDLGKECTISSVSETHKKILALLDSKEAITIDASHIEIIDTAATQLLCSMVQSAGKKSVRLEWVSPSDRFLSVATRLDLRKHLQIESAVNG